MRKNISKLIVPVLLGMGIVATFFREMVVAYYFGSSREVEIYRVAFAIPYSLFQSLGTVLVGALLPILIAEGDHIIYTIKKNMYKVFLILGLIAFLTVDIQARFLAPGFSVSEQEILKYNLVICWIILIFASMIFPIRLLLQRYDKKALVSATSLLFSLFFVILIFLFHNNSSYILSAVSSFSLFLLYVVYRWGYGFGQDFKIAVVNNGRENREIDKKIQKIILGSFIYVFLLAVPRLLDRAFASKMGNGVIANLDYAMNFYVAFGVLIGTSFTIIFAKKIAQEYQNLTIKWFLKIIGTPFLIASIIVLILYPFSEELVKLAYFRGAFNIEDVKIVASILKWFLLALPAMVVVMILLQIVAAYNIAILIGIIAVKILIKYIWLFSYAKDESLNIFGKSTFVMELVAIGVIYFVLNKLNKKQKRENLWE